MPFEPVTLEGDLVRLEPLALRHRDGLTAAVEDGSLWRLHVTSVPHPQDIEAFIAAAGEHHRVGAGLAFAIIEKSSGRVVGSTRFLNAYLERGRVEIGSTFIGAGWQKTRVNTETKLILLSHAFDVLHVNRVEFLTDYLNRNSREAILRLGAKQEGVLRNHVVMPNGRIRDSVIFSIIKNEWPGVKEHLENKLSKPINGREDKYY